jgi:pseudouridine synthase
VRYLGKIPPAQRSWIQEDPRHTWLVFVLHEGRNRQVRRMCQAVGMKVRRLVRVRIADIDLGDLKPGQWRLASKKQLKAIRAIKTTR